MAKRPYIEALRCKLCGFHVSAPSDDARLVHEANTEMARHLVRGHPEAVAEQARLMAKGRGRADG